MKISYTQSRNIYDYKVLTNSLVHDFGYGFLHTLMVWCKLIDDPFEEDQYWEIWIVKHGRKPVGICGLYTLEPNQRSEMWLGWFGIVPELRSLGIGEQVLGFLKNKAKSEGCERLMSYVDKEGKPLPFYMRNGFKVKGTVEQFLINNKDKKIDMDNFENMDDHIIQYDYD